MPVLISVYITSYNQKAYLIEAIESVLNQTLKPFEIIIVDDCSTDGSQEVIERYAQMHPGLIRPFCHDQNIGISRNRNFALEQVCGNLVTYLDGDDRFLPRKLEMELETFMNYPDAQIVYSNVYYIDADGQQIGLWADDNTTPPSGYVFREVFSRDFPRGLVFRNELVAYSCLKKTGFYDDRFQIYEDWELRIRLTKHFQVAYCAEPLVEYRYHSGGLSSLPASVHLSLIRRVYEKNRPLLDDLPEADCIMIEKRLSTKFAQAVRLAALQEIGRGNRKLALKYWIESLRYDHIHFHPRLAAQIVLPRRVYRRLKALYHDFRKYHVIRVALAFYYLISAIYWWMVRAIVKTWRERGLHLVSVGHFVTGEWKTRSLYREDMILRTILLFVDLRGRSCLDLACNDGFWSFRLGRFGIKRLVGIDLAQREIFRSNFLKTVYNFPSFQFKRRDIFQFLYHENGETYDIILLLSIIYHLPEQTDWSKFFNTLYQINEECLVIDTRWFDDDEYWYDRKSGQAIIETEHGNVKKWRPRRNEVFSYLYRSGYEQVIEISPSAFIRNHKEAYGNGDPYTLQNVSDYITDHRTIVIAYKRMAMIPDIGNRLSVKYV